MVGGAPLTQDYVEKIGADGYTADANQAVASAKALVGSRIDCDQNNAEWLPDQDSHFFR